ncbi:hypothetical protein SARC_03256 [Sphaeroforma arctica JP610]|uniref:Uncharacterized protein n=1 Tax=Sphaeroforma arctica JP610 TaxID=667725 RepID=A0A0L0G671_9EUKA|nr:hypothetical protein SARC_03256 [Sphaeroforma arctica JP610]KNC84530.1 hypothetical protein SARC_03256 [Sphaeroforma arctica JP610]|eukprot:XP_014158432.1 hypothetical protein SARC_03256 [Sphaeroforma arctica JP610]
MSKTLPGLTHLTNTAVAGFDFDSETKIDRHHSDSGERPSPNLDNMSNKLGRDRAGSASAIPKTIKEKRDSFFKYAKSRWRENSFSLNKSKQENDDCTKGLDVQK